MVPAFVPVPPPQLVVVVVVVVVLCCVWCSSLLSLLLLLLPAADLPVVTAGQEVRCPEQQQSRGLLLRGVNNNTSWEDGIVEAPTDVDSYEDGHADEHHACALRLLAVLSGLGWRVPLPRDEGRPQPAFPALHPLQHLSWDRYSQLALQHPRPMG